jgi:hypothetical protein
VPAPMLPSLVSVQSTLNPVLNAGTEYWLDISAPSTAALWLDNDQDVRSPVAVNQNGSGFVLLTDFGGNPPVQPAFRINGDSLALSGTFTAVADPVAADLPEPSTFLLVLAALLLYRPARMVLKMVGLRAVAAEQCHVSLCDSFSPGPGLSVSGRITTLAHRGAWRHGRALRALPLVLPLCENPGELGGRDQIR